MTSARASLLKVGPGRACDRRAAIACLPSCAQDGPMPEQRIYLDNAATSWPKPEAVYRAVDQYQRRSMLGSLLGYVKSNAI